MNRRHLLIGLLASASAPAIAASVRPYASGGMIPGGAIGFVAEHRDGCWVITPKMAASIFVQTAPGPHVITDVWVNGERGVISNVARAT